MLRFMFLLLVLATGDVYGDALAVIVNKDAEANVLTDEQIYDVFIFRNGIWENSIPVTVVVMPLHSPEHRAFLDKYVGMGYLGYQRRFNNRVNSSKSMPPIIVNTRTEALDTVSKYPGGISYTEDDIRDILDSYNIDIVEIR